MREGNDIVVEHEDSVNQSVGTHAVSWPNQTNSVLAFPGILHGAWGAAAQTLTKLSACHRPDPWIGSANRWPGPSQRQAIERVLRGRRF